MAWRLPTLLAASAAVVIAIASAPACTNTTSVFLDPDAGGSGGTGGAGGSAGGDATCSTAEDCPGVDSDCAARACVDGACSTVNAPLGTVCDDDGGNSCDGQGSCVECVLPSDCPGDQQCVEEQCVPAQCVNGALDGDETDVDCGGSCPPCDIGQQCIVPGDCDSGFCDAGVCAPCSTDSQCLSTQYCDAGTCTDKKGVGETCNAPNECTSGFCPGQDGTCCNEDCTAPCEACVAVKTGQPNGTCATLAAGTDPDMECGAQPVSTCGANGMGCSGVGPFCTLYSAGTECAPGFCSGAAIQSPSLCDGNGQCNPGLGLSCAPFGCNAAGTACANSCSNLEPCAPGFACVGGTCVPPLPNGQPCSLGSECLSNQCVDGVCCNAACNAECQACSQSKTGLPDGTCSAVSANTDPDMECSDTGGPCGSNGTGCNGNPLSPGCNGYACTCAQQYQSPAIYEVCPGVSPSQCKLRINSVGNNSCDAICAQGGGECVGAFNDNPNGTCGQSATPLACNFSGFTSMICFCSSGCGAHASCSPPDSCSNGLCL